MKNHKRIIAGILSAITVIGCGSCNQSGGRAEGDATQTTTAAAVTTEDPNKEIDIEVDYEGMADIDAVDESNEAGTGELWETGKTAGTIQVLSFFDFINIAPEKDIAELFAERFGGTVETEVVSSLEVSNRLGVLMAAGQSPDLMRSGEEYFPGFFLQNRFTNLDGYLDMNSPMWSDMSGIIEQYSYNGEHFYFPYAMTATGYGITYNAAELEEIGAEDPMELYFAGEWTWDKLEEIALEWKASNPDKFPISWPETGAIQLAATTGIPAIQFTGTEIINNMKDPNITRAMEFVEKLKREECFWEGWHGPDGLESWLGTLFFVMPADWALPCGQEIFFKNQLEGEIRTVPMPRDPNSDKYYLYGATSGYLVPAGADNVQGGAAYILASRIWATDPDVVAADREEKMYDGGYFYIKCAECKYKFETERDEIDAVCPECQTPRKAKFKMIYTEDQQRVFDDMLDPSKFTFVFDCHRGFGTDIKQYIYDVFDGPVVSDSSYSQLLTEYYNVIESGLDQYRTEMAENAS